MKTPTLKDCIGGVIFALCILLIVFVKMDNESRIAIISFGSLTGNFLFGSSSSSQKKDDANSEQTKQLIDGLANSQPVPNDTKPLGVQETEQAK